jgi:hypothetical protein
MDRRLALRFSMLCALAAAGCQPHIGGQCALSTDCSIDGSRQCDTSQPGGYCTIFNCSGDTCGTGAACLLFNPQVPGCPYDDYRSPARTARSQCMQVCNTNNDCRGGYICVDARQQPWGAAILDDDQQQLVCIAPWSSVDVGSSADAAVCQPSGPTVPPIDASVNLVVDASAEAGDAGDASGAGDAAGDSAVESGSDAPADVQEAGDAPADAGDGASDASNGG